MNKKIEDGGSAFPGGLYEPQHGGSNDREPMNHGMSLRDWFASQAMAAIQQRGFEMHEAGSYLSDDSIASEAYELADAMLAARSAKT